MINSTDETFEEDVLKSDVPVLVDFWAEWCNPCLQIAPALEELSEKYQGEIKIVKMDIDKNPGTPSKLGVRSIPALFLFKDGKVISNKSGSYPKAALDVWIKGSILYDDEENS
jgi:thioredoxin 1